MRVSVKSLRFSLALTVLAGFAATVSADDWPTFRGANRTAISAESGLLDHWAQDGPRLLWTAQGAGRGYASPAVSAGRIYTLGDGPSTADGDKDEYLTCFNADNGQAIWKSKTGPAWNEGKASWQGSRATPSIDGELLYVITPHGQLICAKTSDGSIAWQKDLKEDFGGKKKDQWGYSESPLVDGNLVLCTPGGEKSTVVALDKQTGELVWSCQHPGDVGAGHSSIVISHVAGRKIYVQNTGGGPIGIAADTGELKWAYDMAPPTAFIPTPIIKGDYVYSVAGYKLGGALLQQIPGTDGSISIKEIYGPQTKLGNKHGGVVLVGNHLYFGVEDQSIFKCADLMTGEVVWEKRSREGKDSTSVVVADGKLFLRYQNGVVSVAQLSPEDYEVSSWFKTPGSGDSDKPSWAHPVISNGRLILREDDAILCYEIRK
ncbi:PQQ-binding-like beta-propeller repeat protein [Aureliella helgolandensis]|uniref:Outer membrane protein assembly factor BamB n=1 Tax=Aureliella helgolandensis TaxID=2527968 RepID=A0A518G5D2_9BACT|nr:PQQ-binding-like beta-propeller repeat protein [Aureliella helgolandensis]QDV23790.1 Outer membrane protein assembly factor BamB precursor [Aureliella helgolandensis]